MSAFELIVLDCDGTLADTRPVIVSTLVETFVQTMGRNPDRGMIHGLVARGLPLADTIRAVTKGLDCPLDAVQISRQVALYRDLHLRHGLSSTRLFEGFKPVLEASMAANVSVAVVSNKGQAALESLLDHHGVSSLVALVLGDTDHRPRKPDPALLLEHVLPKAGLPTLERVLVVGDTEVDMAFARNAGVASCWARFGYGDAETCLRFSPKHIIDNPIELLAVIGISSTAQVQPKLD